MKTCETFASPTGCLLPAGSVHVLSSSGESTDHDHSDPAGSRRPPPVQNAGPQRSVQLNQTVSRSAPSMVNTCRAESTASSSSSSTEIARTSPSKHDGTGSRSHALLATGRKYTCPSCRRRRSGG